MNGVIKKLTDKGFGFITVEGRSKDLFFHFSKCKCDFTTLREGDNVVFDEILDDNGKGDAAMGVDLA